VFTDSKTFADAIPKQSIDLILRDYHRQRPRSPAALRRFVAAHFTLPSAIEPVAPATGDTPIVEHIDGLWKTLTRAADADLGRRSSLLPLPHPYVVPGGRFREMYYWDSYFTMLGLKQSGRLDLAADMVENFAYLIDEFGHVPNGTRTYYLSRSQPPFFFEMVALLSAAPDSADSRYLPQLRREYAYWMRGAQGLGKGTANRRVVAMPDGSLLNRYWDDLDQPRDESFREDVQLARRSGRAPRRLYRDIRAAAESGWDFSSRWLADPHRLSTIETTDIVPVDLNSLLFGLELAIGSGCARLHDEPCQTEFEQRARQRRAAIDRYLWDARSGVYLDFRWTHQRRSPRITAATLYPLFVGAASAAQAAGVARNVEHRLLEPGGIAASSIDTGEQWDSPNGWAPLQWIAVDGLRRYGQTALAATIACRWMQSVDRVYRESGKLVEKYDVVDVGRRGGGGEYPTQDRFGWTNGVMRQLMSLYPAARSPAAADCQDWAATSAAPSVK
jgi:alpha,alpha-trehalase